MPTFTRYFSRGSSPPALAITLARNGHEVVLWGHDPEHIATLERDRCNAAFLPDVPFPDTLHLESDLATALAASRNILVVVPSHVFGEVLRQIKPLMRPDARLVWATKGLEAETGRLLQRYVQGHGPRGQPRGHFLPG